MWEDIATESRSQAGWEWDLLAADPLRDPHHQGDYEQCKGDVQLLADKALAHYHEFIPRGDIYYKMMEVCGFIVRPSIDETQSGTLARIIARKSLTRPRRRWRS